MSEGQMTVGHGTIDETLRRHWVMFGDDCPCEVCHLARELAASKEREREGARLARCAYNAAMDSSRFFGGLGAYLDGEWLDPEELGDRVAEYEARLKGGDE